MFKENNKIESLLRIGRKLIPKSVFKAAQPIYHWGLAMLAAARYRWPSREMKVIGITGTHGKSTTVYMLTQALRACGVPTAALGSLEIRINDKSWPNSLKMTMPGRFKIQSFLAQAKAAGCKYVVLEVTSEGIKQFRHAGIKFDCAVLTNLAAEHIEAHGTFEKYQAAKQKLFKATDNIHILNHDDISSADFAKLKSKKKIFFGLRHGDVTQAHFNLQLKLRGDFNLHNALAAMAVIHAYDLDEAKAKQAIDAIENIPGRMEFVQRDPFAVVVDYAHTPHALEKVFQELKPQSGRLICVFGGTGGGRDKWKRSKMGEAAGKYCDKIILTTDDPYDEDPAVIAREIEAGIQDKTKVLTIIDRREAIRHAISHTQPGDAIVITGKGSEDRMVLSNGKKIEWSDRDTAMKMLNP